MGTETGIFLIRGLALLKTKCRKASAIESCKKGNLFSESTRASADAIFAAPSLRLAEVAFPVGNLTQPWHPVYTIPRYCCSSAQTASFTASLAATQFSQQIPNHSLILAMKTYLSSRTSQAPRKHSPALRRSSFVSRTEDTVNPTTGSRGLAKLAGRHKLGRRLKMAHNPSRSCTSSWRPRGSTLPSGAALGPAWSQHQNSRNDSRCPCRPINGKSKSADSFRLRSRRCRL